MYPETFQVKQIEMMPQIDIISNCIDKSALLPNYVQGRFMTPKNKV